MIVQIQKGDSFLTSSTLHEQTNTTLVYTDDGLPMAVMYQVADKIVIRTAEESGFADTLEALGLPKRMIPEVQKMTLKTPGRG